MTGLKTRGFLPRSDSPIDGWIDLKTIVRTSHGFLRRTDSPTDRRLDLKRIARTSHGFLPRTGSSTGFGRRHCVPLQSLLVHHHVRHGQRHRAGPSGQSRSTAQDSV
jgi:hypothetical protein